MQLRYAIALLLTSAFSVSAQQACQQNSAPWILGLQNVQQSPYAAWCESTKANPDNSIKDFLYTTDTQLNDWAIDSLGYIASSPKAKFFLEGHSQSQSPGNNNTAYQTNAIYRFVSPSQLIHYYSKSSSLPSGTGINDWQLDGSPGIDGHLYTAQAPDSSRKPVYLWVGRILPKAYRLASTQPNPFWDLVSPQELGYAATSQPVAFQQGNPESWQNNGTSFQMMRRCKTANLTSCAIGDAVVSGATYRNLSKGTNNTHTLTYTFSTDAEFLSNDSIHLSSGIRGNLLGTSFSGVAVVIGKFNAANGQLRCNDNNLHVAFEAVWKEGTAVKNLVPSESCSQPLVAGRAYKIVAKSKDDGSFSYTLTDKVTNQTTVFSRPAPWAIQQFPIYKFPSDSSYADAWIAPVWDTTMTERTAYFWGISTAWTTE